MPRPLGRALDDGSGVVVNILPAAFTLPRPLSGTQIRLGQSEA